MASSSGRQPNFAALNRGRHLYSAGRPSRWALAHIFSSDFNAVNKSNGYLSRADKVFTTTTTVLRPFLQDHPGEPVPEENFWTLWCKGRLTEADTPTIRLSATPSGLTGAHLHNPPYFLQVGCPSCCPTNSVKALKATSAFRLGRICWSSPQRCYLHCLRTSEY